MVGLAKGCMTDYEAGKELVDKLKQGQMLLFESVDADDLPVNLRVPLAEFASAYDGPARDPRVIEESRLSQEEMKVMLERPRRHFRREFVVEPVQFEFEEQKIGGSGGDFLGKAPP